MTPKAHARWKMSASRPAVCTSSVSDTQNTGTSHDLARARGRLQRARGAPALPPGPAHGEPAVASTRSAARQGALALAAGGRPHQRTCRPSKRSAGGLMRRSGRCCAAGRASARPARRRRPARLDRVLCSAPVGTDTSRRARGRRRILRASMHHMSADTSRAASWSGLAHRGVPHPVRRALQRPHSSTCCGAHVLAV